MNNLKKNIRNIVILFLQIYLLYCASNVILNGVENSYNCIETFNIALGIITIITISIIIFHELIEFLTSK